MRRFHLRRRRRRHRRQSRRRRHGDVAVEHSERHHAAAFDGWQKKLRLAVRRKVVVEARARRPPNDALQKFLVDRADFSRVRVLCRIVDRTAARMGRRILEPMLQNILQL